MKGKDVKILEEKIKEQEERIDRISQLAIPIERKIRVFKDKKMLISEWAFFIVQSGVMLLTTFWCLDFIKGFESQEGELIGLIVIVFFVIRLYALLRPPIEYRTEEVIDDLEH